MKPLAPETARLLADLSGLRAAEEERSEERIVRLSQDPAALFAAINLRPPPLHPLSDLRGKTQAAVAASLIPVTVLMDNPKHQGPAPVLRALQATAPAIAAPTRHQECLSSFTPTSADRREAIEALESSRRFLGLLLAAVAISALLLWLLL